MKRQWGSLLKMCYVLCAYSPPLSVLTDFPFIFVFLLFLSICILHFSLHLAHYSFVSGKDCCVVIVLIYCALHIFLDLTHCNSVHYQSAL